MHTPATLEALIELLLQSDEVGYIGEPVSQLAHGLQAAYFTRKAGGRDLLVAAALLHDVGHLAFPDAPTMDNLGTIEHEELGANYLRAIGFPNELCRIVAGHVPAKRYLTWRSVGYLERLSPASMGTLIHQGGAMSDIEAHTFEQDPLFEEMLLLRSCDEQAKVPDLEVPNLDSYIPLLRSLLQN
jgi:2-amino-1-hydroxyethylphosphonate dioxygenase (glycine-forming)